LYPQEEKVSEGLAVGDKVWLVGLNVLGIIDSMPDSSGQVEVQVGNTRIRMAPENLEKAEAPARSAVKSFSEKFSTSKGCFYGVRSERKKGGRGGKRIGCLSERRQSGQFA
jgi:hypothetical protein